LGIDPGSRITGYGVIETQKNGIVELARGEIKPARQSPLSLCLTVIHRQLLEVIDRLSPGAISIEDIFYGKNVKSLIKQGHVRGVAILAGAMRQVPVFEYTPLEIKQAVVGYGRAEKSQVQTMVKAILKLSDMPSADAADALAVAICHINTLKVKPL
jgi:crossover junction endodeoxyribonuclease RuvC